MYKVFQKDVFDLHDDPARIAAKRFWNSLGYECQDNPDDFGEDLLVTGKGKKFYCEVEVKTVWHGTKFHFDSLHIPCLLYTSPSPRDATLSRMPSSA